jgi:hypothetical protein
MSTTSEKPKFGFRGNPREHRVLLALLTRPQPREHIDRTAGCSNGPQLIAGLRERGLDLPCTRAVCFDRDGLEVRRGIYNLTVADRRRVYRAFRVFAERGGR